jgi:DNA/RNA-binding domain of Phe-tRNA-synthetase-like protein
VTFVDAARRAHARRWTNRQSGRSAVRDSTSRVLIVAEALHETAAEDLPVLMKTVADAVTATWQVSTRSAVLSPQAPRFTI